MEPGGRELLTPRPYGRGYIARARESVESDGCRHPEPHRLTTAATLLAISIALYAASFSPWDLSPACWLALVPLLSVVRRLPPRAAAGAGLLWGIGSNFAVGYWVPGAIRFYYEQPWWFGWIFCLLTSLVFWAPYYALFAALAAWARPRLGSTAWSLLVAALWVVAEIGRANLLTGAPWLMLGYALVPHAWLRQAADIGGVNVL